MFSFGHCPNYLFSSLLTLTVQSIRGNILCPSWAASTWTNSQPRTQTCGTSLISSDLKGCSRSLSKPFEGSLKSVREVSAWWRRSSLFHLDLVGEFAWGRLLPRTLFSSSLPHSSSSSGDFPLPRTLGWSNWRFEKPEAHMEPDPNDFTDGFTIIPKPYYVNIKHVHCK